MKMICDRTLLSNAVAGVSKAVTQRSSIPVLEGILMKAEGFSLTLTGYDLEMGITTSIEANVLEPGEVVLSAKLLGDMVRRLSSSEVEITATETNATTIKGGITEFDIMGMNPGDFPELPSPGADHTLDLETPTFREMVETTLFAVSQDDKKPAHTGELFAIEPDKLTVVALDGYRLAIIEKPVKAAKAVHRRRRGGPHCGQPPFCGVFFPHLHGHQPTDRRGFSRLQARHPRGLSHPCYRGRA